MIVLSISSVVISVIALVGVAFWQLKVSQRLARSSEELVRMRDEIAAAKTMLFAYEAQLHGENGRWCLICDGHTKWYAPGKLLRTESKDGKTVSDFSYDENGGVTVVSKVNGEVASEVTLDKNGVPVKGAYTAEGVKKEVHYTKFGQVEK